MNKTAICIVVNDLYYQTRFFVENLVSKTKINIRLHVLDNNSNDPRITEFFESFCKKDNRDWTFERTEQTLSVAQSYNRLLESIQPDEKYVCICPVNLMVNDHWLESIKSFYVNISNSGIVAIRTGSEKTFFIPVLHESTTDEPYLVNVWFTENNSVEGILFFNKEILDKVGNFDVNLNADGFEQSEFAFRVSANGYKNYYIRNQTCSKVDTENPILFPKRTDVGIMLLRNEIESMVKANNFYKKSK